MIYKSADRNKIREKNEKSQCVESFRSPNGSSLNINQFDFFSSASLRDKIGSAFMIQTSVYDL